MSLLLWELRLYIVYSWLGSVPRGERPGRRGGGQTWPAPPSSRPLADWGNWMQILWNWKLNAELQSMELMIPFMWTANNRIFNWNFLYLTSLGFTVQHVFKVHTVFVFMEHSASVFYRKFKCLHTEVWLVEYKMWYLHLLMEQKYNHSSFPHIKNRYFTSKANSYQLFFLHCRGFCDFIMRSF